MSLPDPIPTITVDSVAYDLFRTDQFGERSVYQTADGLTKLTVSHVLKNRHRFMVRFDRSKVAADPFNADLNQEYVYAAYTVLDVPKLGVSVDEANDLGQLLRDFMVAGTPDYEVRVLRGET